VAQHVPSLDSHRFANSDSVAGIEFNSRCPWGRCSRRSTSTALIEEDQLTVLCEWSERRPQNVVTEVQSTVDAEQREIVPGFRTRENRELESSRFDDLLREVRSFPLPFPEFEKSRASEPMRMCSVSHPVASISSFRLDRHAFILPRTPSANEGACFFPPCLPQRERRTGAGGFVHSGTIDNKCRAL
jgi:hypothetical protein